MDNFEKLGFSSLTQEDEKLTEGGLLFLAGAVQVLAGAAAVGFAAGAAHRLGEEVYNYITE